MPTKDTDKLKAKAHRAYLRRKEQVRLHHQKSRDANKAFIASLKVGWICKCGESDPVCIDFHHREGKEIAISRAIRAFGPKRLREEIAKCDMICSNCHRKLHKDDIYKVR
jgi:hypothetical protein